VQAIRARLVLGNAVTELDRLAGFIRQFGRNAQLPADFLLAVDLALTEWVTNIFSYGFPDATSRPVVTIELSTSDTQFRAEIQDNGIAFNPLQHPLPDTSIPLEKKPIGGLGIFLIRKFMDEISYHRNSQTNSLTMLKGIGGQGIRWEE
jgi:anti-sigma regulatory factor (Ser/Thr protein kinase)